MSAQFKQKYPAFTALIHIVALEGKALGNPDDGLIAKVGNSMKIIPEVLLFLPQSKTIGAEAAQLKSSATDIEDGIEMLVVDLEFSSEKAKKIIEAAFPVADKIAALIPETQNLIAAIKS